MKQHLQHPVFSVISGLPRSKMCRLMPLAGYVRDIFLNRPSKDIDIVVIGNGIDFAEAVAAQTERKGIRIQKLWHGYAALPGCRVEFVGARKESYRLRIAQTDCRERHAGRRPETPRFYHQRAGHNFKPRTYGVLVDPFGGIADMEQKLIRTPLNPVETFSDDPLRMMRAIRFASQLNFRIDDEAIAAIKNNLHRIKIVSQERITDELNKIILSAKPSIGFNYLFDTGLLHIIFPQMTALYGVEIINGKGHKDNFYHTLQVLDNICETTRRPLAALGRHIA
jgi:poly(A) polymerase